ncbi:MAG: class I SAM-dependent methyltransferase [bacterium]|nr:class I SAM-dependent methyltransferase [bacterium]
MNSKNFESTQAVDRAVYQLKIFRTHEYEMIRDFITNKTVLHVGCRDGESTALMAESAAKVVGIDSSAESVKKARESNKKGNVEFIMMDSIEEKNLPFQSSSFDVIVAFQFLESIADPSHFFKEIKRVLKDKGILILSTHNRSIRLFPFQAPWNYFHKKEYDYYEFENLIARHFEEFRIKDLSFTGMCRRRELGRLTKVKIFLAPFSAVFVPDKMRIRMLEIIWNVFKGDLLFFLGKRSEYKASEREIRYVKKHIAVREMSKANPLYFISFCTNSKKTE